MTTIPLSIADPDGSLQTGYKAKLRNVLIDESKSEERSPPHKATWVTGGVAVVNVG